MDIEELWLREELRLIQDAYIKQAEPYIKKLIQIEARKPIVHTYLLGEIPEEVRKYLEENFREMPDDPIQR